MSQPNTAMSHQMRRWYALALKIALDNPHAGQQSKMMGAVVVGGGRVLACSSNGFGRHAEHRAIRGRMFEGATIVIARANLSMSRPCPACYSHVQAAGIDRIVYAGWDKGLIMEEVSEEAAIVPVMDRRELTWGVSRLSVVDRRRAA